MRGRIFAVVGPSGAGKDTLLAGVCGPGGPHWVRRVITRTEEAGGEPFEGISAAGFAAREAAGDFALSWRAHGLAYGIPKAELAPRHQGRDVVFNGSRAALPQAAAVFPDLRVIVITAPAEVLAMRLAARGRESAAQIDARLKREVEPRVDLPQIEIVNDATPEAGIARLRQALARPDPQPSGAR